MLDIIDTDIRIIFYKFFVGTDVIHALDAALTDNDILLQISFAVIGVMPYLQTPSRLPKAFGFCVTDHKVEAILAPYIAPVKNFTDCPHQLLLIPTVAPKAKPATVNNILPVFYLYPNFHLLSFRS